MRSLYNAVAAAAGSAVVHQGWLPAAERPALRDSQFVVGAACYVRYINLSEAPAD